MSARILVALTFAMAGAPTSAHALGAAATRAPADITYWGRGDPRTTRQVVHTLAVQAGPEGERLVVSTSSASPVTLTGPGQLVPFGGLSSARAEGERLAGRDACPPRTTTLGASVLYRLELPPGASSVLHYTDELSLTAAPRDPAPFTAGWSLRAQDDADAGPPPLHIGEDPPRLLGILATALTLRAGRTGSGEAIDDRESIQVRARTDMTLSGTLSYARRGEGIVVRAFAPGVRGTVLIGTARVDRHGRFLLRHWRPRRAGLWELFATYAGRPGSVERTRSPCSGPRVTVVG